MPRFVFSLETLLKQRRNVEKQRQRELAASISRRDAVRRRIEDMQGQIVQAKQSLGRALVGRVDLEEVSRFAQYSGAVAQHVRGSGPELAKAEGEVRGARLRLQQAIRDRKALELLRQKELDAWKRRLQRREDAELDELSVQAYARRLSEAHSASGGE